MSDSPFLRRTANKTSHGKASERRQAGKLSAKLQPASGAIDGAKGDMVIRWSDRKLLVEAKCTINQSISLKKEWLQKLLKESMAQNSEFLLTVAFVNGDGKLQDANSEFVLMPMNLFKEITNV